MKKAIIKKVQKGRNIGQYRFTLKASNGKTIGTSGSETYHNLADCESTLKNNFGDFEIVYSF